MDNFVSRLGANSLTIKYDANGTAIWNATYDSGFTDWTTAVVTDSNNQIIVAGYSIMPGGNYDYFVVKYLPS